MMFTAKLLKITVRENKTEVYRKNILYIAVSHKTKKNKGIKSNY